MMYSVGATLVATFVARTKNFYVVSYEKPLQSTRDFTPFRPHPPARADSSKLVNRMSNKKRIMMIRPGKWFPRMAFGPPLGLLSLVPVLRRKFPDTFDIKLVEQALYDLSTGDIKQQMEDFRPDLVLISCLSVEANEMREAAAMSKTLFPEVPVWLGGSHSTVFYDWELLTGNVDAVCIGEGEHTFEEMIRAWLYDKPLDDVPGVALFHDGAVVTTGARPPIEDLDSLDLPAWDLVDLGVYSNLTSMNTFVKARPWALLFTSRACPFHCVYCHNVFGKKPRWRSVEHVLEEIELLYYDYGVRELHIVDDIFNLNLPRAKSICDQIVERGLDIKIAFPNGLRGDRMDRELIRKLKAAGTYSITYAVETASPRLQKLIKKNIDLEKMKEVIAWTDEEKLITQAFFMLGFPTETLEEMEMTISYALNSRLMRAWFFTVVVYPRTELFEIAKREYPEFDFSGYNFFNLRYWSEEPFYNRVTGIDVYKIQRKGYRRFFMRPSIILGIFSRFPKNRWLLIGLYYGGRSVLTSLNRLEWLIRPVQKRVVQLLARRKKNPA